MTGCRGCTLVLLGLLLLGCGGCLGGAVSLGRHSYMSQGSYGSLEALSKAHLDPAARRGSFVYVEQYPGAALPLQDTSNLVYQHQQQLHGQQQSARSGAEAKAAPVSWNEVLYSSKSAFQALGSSRRLSQSLWDVVGSLLQQAQQQVQHARSSRQLATDSNSFEQQLWNMPGDPTAGERVLQPIEPLLAWPTFGAPQPPQEQPDSSLGSSSNSNSNRLSGPVNRGTGPAKLELRIRFTAMGSVGISLRLPLPPRTFTVEVQVADDITSRFDCVTDLVYKDQVVTCPGLELNTNYVVFLFDQQDESLELTQLEARTGNDIVTIKPVPVILGMVQVEASFGSLAWAGMYYPKPRVENTAIVIHAQIVGAQVVVYTKDQPGSIWDMQWTGDDGTASFFLVPNSQQFIANMSVGDTLLRSSVISFSASPDQPSNNPLSQQPQQQLLTAATELLCTGEVEDVRGESGQFPANLTAQQGGDKTAIYHPRGFSCQWELLPDYPELTLTVDYSNLLPDESITLYLAPSNVIQLRRPEKADKGGIFQTTVWVERSIFVEFQTTRNSTSDVGAFSVSWSSNNPHNRSIVDRRTMVVVLACVSAAGAVLAAFCFYCMCCNRRRRGAVVVDTAAVQRVSLLRVPSSVRELLPSKPYQPPEDSPLPGAATEPDCCSICLVELEAGEHLTVLPCMHFYHKECIDSWLKRNCTCPLCKANVIHGFANTAAGSNNITQQVQRSRRRHRHRRAGSASAAGDGDAAGEGGSGEQQQTVQDADAAAIAAGASAGLGAAAEIEMTQPPAAAAGGSAFEQQAGQLQAAYPVVYASSAGGSSGSGSSSLTAASGDAVVMLQLPGGAAAAAGLKQSGSSTSNSDASASNGRSGRPPLSPAASLGTLQSGTVQASPADFAAAAAAAAAALAAAAAGIEEGEPGSNATAARSGAVTPPGAAAQASVSALRGSSWVWGRGLQGLLRAPSGAGVPDAPAAAAAAAAGVDAAASSSASHHTVEMPPAAAAGSRQVRGNGNSRSSSRASARSPEQMLPMLPSVMLGRVAVSIYAYAGNPQPLGSGTEEEAHTGRQLEGIVVEPSGQSLVQQQQHQQQLVRHEGSLGLGWFAGEAGSSSTAAIHGVPAAGASSSSNNGSGVQPQQQDGIEEGDAGSPARRSFSLPGAVV